MRAIILTAQQARRVEGVSMPGYRLEPRLIDAGEFAGRYALPVAVLDDPPHAAKRIELSALTIVDLDGKIAWPGTNSI